jgi:hypothetical protein
MTSQLSIFSAVAVVGVLAGPAPFDPRPTDPSRQDHTVHAPAPPAGQAMAGMMKMREEMMAAMKVEADHLDSLVKQMNAADGAAKTEAIAAVVNELVRQHTAMQERMHGMHRTMPGGHATPAKP